MDGQNKKRVFVLGGTGFVGYYVLRAFDEHGFQQGILLHNKKDDLDIPFEGYDIFEGDIRKLGTIEKAFKEFRPDVVVHLVGIIREKPPAKTFQNIHINGTQNIVDAAKATGVKKIIYISVLGADKNSSSRYYKSKAGAEDIIRASGFDFTIFRPATMFGWRASFTQRLARLIKYWPFVPLVGKGATKFQPVAAKVTAEVIAQAAEGKGSRNTYDVVGPETLTYKEAVIRMRDFVNSKKFVIGIPAVFVYIGSQFRKLGIPVPITTTEFKTLRQEHLGDLSALKQDFVVKDIYFDPAGQYPLQ